VSACVHPLGVKQPGVRRDSGGLTVVASANANRIEAIADRGFFSPRSAMTPKELD
jgi:hypothetical protein